MRLSHNRLAAARTTLGLSREQVAVEIHRSYHTVTSYELGRQTPPAEVLGALAELYGVNVDEFYVQEAA